MSGIISVHKSSTVSPCSSSPSPSTAPAQLLSHAFSTLLGSNLSRRTLILPCESHPAGTMTASRSSTLARWAKGNGEVGGGVKWSVGCRGGGVVYSRCRRYSRRKV